MRKLNLIRTFVLTGIIVGLVVPGLTKPSATQAHRHTLTTSVPQQVYSILYTQWDPGDYPNGAILSSNDNSVGSPFTEAADDFVVTGSGWEIKAVEVIGYLGELNAEFSVVFWSDSGGLPGSALCTLQQQTNTGPSNQLPYIELGTPCVLPPGTFWVSVQHQGTSDTGWYWHRYPTIVNSPGAWRAPGNTEGCVTAWTPLNGTGPCVGTTTPDRSFILYGNLAVPNLAASAVCNGDNLEVTITSGDGPFMISSSNPTPFLPKPVTGPGPHIIQGPQGWGDVTVSEQYSNMDSINLGNFFCADLNGGIIIPNGAPGSTNGPASLYPANQVVNGLGTSITDVNVTIFGLGHTFPADVEILLVSPEGTAVQIMGDACANWGGFVYDFTFDDEAAGQLLNGQGCMSGTYQPSVFDSAIFPAPAPAGSYATILSSFDGENPNGTWSLYVNDDEPGDFGDIVNWSLNITAPTGPTPLVASAVCVDENLAVTISAGDGPFNISASAGINTPVTGVNIGTTMINGPEKWDNLTVTETSGNLQSLNLGQFKCRSDERPVPVSPAHRARTTDAFPTFAWSGITGASNYRVFVFDDPVVATRTVDIRQNSGGPTTMVLSSALPNGRLFWRVRARTNRLWSLWSIRFTLFKDPPAPISVSTPVPTIDFDPLTRDGAPTLPAPPNSR